MKKLTTKEKKQVKAGKGVTGSFLSGIGGIFKAIGNFVTDTISTIATTVFMFTDKQHHDKVSYKMGANQVVIDDTKSNASTAGEKHSDTLSEPGEGKLIHGTSTTRFHLEDLSQIDDHPGYEGMDFT